MSRIINFDDLDISKICINLPRYLTIESLFEDNSTKSNQFYGDPYDDTKINIAPNEIFMQYNYGTTEKPDMEQLWIGMPWMPAIPMARYEPTNCFKLELDFDDPNVKKI